MDRLTWQELRHVLEFVRDGYACRDQEAFVTHLLHGIPTLIPSEVTAYGEFDLGSGRLLEASRMAPATGDVPGSRQVFERHMADHPVLTHFQQTGDGAAVTISDFFTRTQYHRTGLYNEYFRRFPAEYQMDAMLGGPAPRQRLVVLNRSRRDFSERERLLLNLLRPHLAQAQETVTALTQAHETLALLRQVVEDEARAVILLSRAGRIRLMTPLAQRAVVEWFGPASADRLPEALQRWVQHQEAVLGSAEAVPPPREPLRVERDGACLLVRHLCEATACLLLLEERRPELPLEVMQRHGLTRREAEVLQWVAQGKTNAEIGLILGASPRTVETHLTHIFEKLGVETRVAAATLALGWRSGA